MENGKQPPIDAVFLTSAVQEFEEARHALSATPIRLHPAATAEQALSLMIAKDARVLLVAATSPTGAWEDGLQMARRLHPPRALVVVAGTVDERFWISALERGAFDVVSMPFDAEELRRTIQNATLHTSRAPRQYRAWAG